MQATFFNLLRLPDQSTALFALAYIDRSLFLLLKARFRELSSADHGRIFNSGPNAILGTTSAKIRISFALGLIDRDVYSELLLLNDVRNVFAHTLRLVNFDSAPIVKDCQKLRSRSIDEKNAFGTDFVPPESNAKTQFCLNVWTVVKIISKRTHPFLLARALENPPT